VFQALMLIIMVLLPLLVRASTRATRCSYQQLVMLCCLLQISAPYAVLKLTELLKPLYV
jgi:hypothetical protein